MKNHQRKLPLVLLFVIQICLQGCYVAPRPVYTLDPVGEDVEWNAGRQIITKSKAGIDIQLSFDTAEGEIVFDVLVMNNTGEKIHVNPARFHYRYTYDGDSLLTAHPAYLALNPESEIINVRKADASNDAKLASDAATNALFATLDVVSDIATIGKAKSAAELEEQQEMAEEREEDMVNSEIRHGYAKERLTNARIFWEEETLRKTDVFDGEYIDGKVVFPIKGEGRFVRIIIPIEHTVFEVTYSLQKH